MMLKRSLDLYKYLTKQITNNSSNNNSDKGYGIRIDQESIKRKKQQMKNPSTKKIKPQFMPSYKIRQPNKKIKQFRQQTKTNQLFAFEDYSLETKPQKLEISSYDEQSLYINGANYPPSIIMFPSQVLIWEVIETQSLKPQHFQIINLIDPKPSYVILGVQNLDKLPLSVRLYLNKIHQNVDILQFFLGVSTFNTANADDVDIIGFFCAK